MKICPNCARELRISSNAEYNARNGPMVVTSECCGYAVQTTPVRDFVVSPYMGLREEDDYGTPIKYDDLAERRRMHGKD